MNVLLLAPKHARDSGPLPDFRAILSRRIAESGNRPVILEAEPDDPNKTLRQKFLRLAAECQQAVLIWPKDAAMATTADELILLQEISETHRIRIILILHQAEVEERAHELHVHMPADQSRYLDGILSCRPYILRWSDDIPFEHLVDRYIDEYL